MLGVGLVALAVVAAIVIQLTTGQIFRSRVVKSEQTAPFTVHVVVESQGLNKNIAIPLLLCFVAGVACTLWPRRKSTA